MHPNPFMDKVCIEVVGQGDIGNRGVSLRTLGDDLGLKGLGIGTAFLWYGRPLKKAKNGVHLNLGGHHRLKRWHQEGVLPGRLLCKDISSKTAMPPRPSVTTSFRRMLAFERLVLLALALRSSVPSFQGS